MFGWIAAAIPSFLQRGAQGPTPPQSPNNGRYMPSVEAEQGSPLTRSSRKRRRPSPYPTPDAEADSDQEKEQQQDHQPPCSFERVQHITFAPPPSRPMPALSRSVKSYEGSEASNNTESTSDFEEIASAAECSPEPDDGSEGISSARNSLTPITVPPPQGHTRQCPVALDIPNVDCICNFRFDDFPTPPTDPPPSNQRAAAETSKSCYSISSQSHELYDLDESEAAGLVDPSDGSDDSEMDVDTERSLNPESSFDQPTMIQRLSPGRTKEAPIEIFDEKEDSLIELCDDDSLSGISGFVPETQLDTVHDMQRLTEKERPSNAASSRPSNTTSASNTQRYLATANMVPLVACIHRALPTEHDKWQYTERWVMRPDLRRALYMDQEKETNKSDITKAFALSKEQRYRKYPFAFQREDGRPYAQYRHLAPEIQAVAQASGRQSVVSMRANKPSCSKPLTNTNPRNEDTMTMTPPSSPLVGLSAAILNMIKCLSGEVASTFAQIHAPAVESKLKELIAREKTLRELLDLHRQLQKHHAKSCQSTQQRVEPHPTSLSGQLQPSSSIESTALPPNTSRIGPSFASIKQQCNAEDAVYSSILTDEDLDEAFESFESSRKKKVFVADPGPFEPSKKKKVIVADPGPSQRSRTHQATGRGKTLESASRLTSRTPGPKPAPAPGPKIANLVCRMDPEVYANMTARAKGKVNAKAVPDLFQRTKRDLNLKKREPVNLEGANGGRKMNKDTRKKKPTQDRSQRLQQSQLTFTVEPKTSMVLADFGDRDVGVSDASRENAPVQAGPTPHKENHLNFNSCRAKAFKRPLEDDTENISDEDDGTLPALVAHTVFQRSPLHCVSYPKRSITSQHDVGGVAESADEPRLASPAPPGDVLSPANSKGSASHYPKALNDARHLESNGKTLRKKSPAPDEASIDPTNQRTMQKKGSSKSDRFSNQAGEASLEAQTNILTKQRNTKVEVRPEAISIEDDEHIPDTGKESKHTNVDYRPNASVDRDVVIVCRDEKRKSEPVKEKDRRTKAEDAHQLVKKRKRSERVDVDNGDILDKPGRGSTSERKKRRQRTQGDGIDQNGAGKIDASTGRGRHKAGDAASEDNGNAPHKICEDHASKRKKKRKRTEFDIEDNLAPFTETGEASQTIAKKKRKHHDGHHSAEDVRDAEKSCKNIEAEQGFTDIVSERNDPYQPHGAHEHQPESSKVKKKRKRTEANRRHQALRKMRRKEKIKARKARQRDESLYRSRKHSVGADDA